MASGRETGSEACGTVCEVAPGGAGGALGTVMVLDGGT